MTKPYDYPGILGERPMPSIAVLTAALRPDDEAAQQAAKHEDWIRFLMAVDCLAMDCGIAPTVRAHDLTAADWRQIALTLARRHVPAFMPPEPLEPIPKGKRRGRPSKDWDDKLLTRMDALIAKGHSIRTAADELATNWREKPSTLDIRYRRMKRSVDARRAVLEWIRKTRQ